MSSFEVRPITPTVGAEIVGIDLREQLTEADVARLRTAWLQHLVLFFRDQDITDEDQVAFALSFGALDVSPFATVWVPKTRSGWSLAFLGVGVGRVVAARARRNWRVQDGWGVSPKLSPVGANPAGRPGVSASSTG